MDLAASVASALIFVTAALSIVAAGITELHCYNSALKTFRVLSLESAGSTTPYFPVCEPDPRLVGTRRCLHGSAEALTLEIPQND